MKYFMHTILVKCNYSLLNICVMYIVVKVNGLFLAEMTWGLVKHCSALHLFGKSLCFLYFCVLLFVCCHLCNYSINFIYFECVLTVQYSLVILAICSFHNHDLMLYCKVQ